MDFYQAAGLGAASSTKIGTTYGLGAGEKNVIFASTTPGASASIFAPNVYFQIKIDGGKGPLSPTGACQATFEAI